MSNTSYYITVDNPAGVRQTVIENFIRFNYAKALNQIGVFNLTLPIEYEKQITADSVLKIWQTIGNSKPRLELETGWLARIFDNISDETGKTLLSVISFDMNLLLKRRTVAYASGTSQSNKTTAVPADNLMKAFVRENLGSLATDTARIFPNFTVENDVSLAAAATKSAAHRNILTMLQEIAADSATSGTLLYFDTVDAGNGSFEFRTFVNQRGTDRTSTALPFAQELENLGKCRLTKDYSEEANYIYAGGQGEESDRLIKEVSDTARIGLSRFGRIEDFIDARNSNNANTVQAEASTALRLGRPKIIFIADILQTENSQYGVHYFWGDRVKARYRGNNFTCLIEAIHVTIEPGQSDKIEVKIQNVS